MFKKTLSALAVACVMLVSAAAAGTIFPAEYTDIDGVTRAGYLDEDGMTVLPFAYAQAGDFADCGLAAVENEQWQTAVIDRTGKIVIAYTDSPVSVDFSDYDGCVSLHLTTACIMRLTASALAHIRRRLAS